MLGLKRLVNKKADAVFEVSWEVCNKVGGIYSVLSSKARQMQAYYGNSYFAIGPYFETQAKGEFKPRPVPKEFEKAFEQMRREGVICRFGTWLVDGEPNAILLDFSGLIGKGDEIKAGLWESASVDSLNAGHDFTEPVVFSWAAGMLVEKMIYGFFKNPVLHCHEWMTGAAILYSQKRNLPIKTVFTTHATILGRTLSSRNIPLYKVIKEIDADKEAYNHGIASKHQLERETARRCTVFTTVSEITSLEAEHFLKRKADVLVYNGLDMGSYPSLDEGAVRKKILSEKMKDFLTWYFFPYYHFNFQETKIFFLASRYEFHNKGMDIFISSLRLLNEKLKKENSSKTVVAMFLVPGAAQGIRKEVFENKENYLDIKESLELTADDFKNETFHSIAAGLNPSISNIVSQDIWKEIERKILKFKRDGIPPACTHNLPYVKDEILHAFYEAGLRNEKNDRVKVIFYPILLSGSDGVLNLTLYETIQSSQLGVFPSFYEPWGYTPLEAAAYGVASVTTDLSGFGRYVSSQKRKEEKYKGVYVLERFNRESADIEKDLSNILYEVANFSQSDFSKSEIAAYQIAATADWRQLAGRYFEAHTKALNSKKYEGRL